MRGATVTGTVVRWAVSILATVSVASCGDESPAGPAANPTAAPEVESVASAEHSVIVEIPLAGGDFGSDAERERVYALEDELAAAIDAAGVGEFDGDAFGAETVTLFAYGPDAEALFAAMEGPLRRFNPPTGSSATLSFGGQDGSDDRVIPLP